MTNSLNVRALSVRQPWAQLILNGVKPVENRTWRSSWRGLLVIHASRGWDDSATDLAASLNLPVPQRCEPGYLGVVELTDIHPGGDCCGPWGEWDVWHWRIVRPYRFVTAVPARGRLGVFQLPTEHTGPVLAAITNSVPAKGRAGCGKTSMRALIRQGMKRLEWKGAE